MNEKGLMQHISYHLHTFVRKYSLSRESEDSFCARFGFEDELIEKTFLKNVLTDFVSSQTPVLVTVNQDVLYAGILCCECSYIIGPVQLTMPVYVRRNYGGIELDSEWLHEVPFCSFDDFINDVLLIYNLYHQKMLKVTDITSANQAEPVKEENIQKHYVETLFHNQENSQTHNPYDQEIREFTSIENGDIRSLEQSWAEDYDGEVGTLAKAPLRHWRNIGIVIITLASRAAIRGGIPPELSFSLSDSYIQQIEELNDTGHIVTLMRNAEYHYTRMVADLKSSRQTPNQNTENLHVSKCKDYIFSHLHDQIRVQEIAKELGINANYLSGLFKKQEGIGIARFILNEKINLAKNLLVYSGYSYIEIANYLGFSSQSHLGKQFREFTGMTPYQYRNKYGTKAFNL